MSPLQFLFTSTFAAQSDKTSLRLQMQACNASSTEQLAFNAGHASHASVTQGWGGTLAQLDAWLATSPTKTA